MMETAANSENNKLTRKVHEDLLWDSIETVILLGKEGMVHISQ